jgi:predicted dehydrogenase
LLEKPIAETYEKCRAIYDKATEKGCRVFVCHVLRYAPKYRLAKEELASGKYGDVVTISVTENVGFHHQCHSYVRGNWADTEKSTPMIIAKCCHDTDMISWWMGHKPCASVSSYGSLTYFNKEHAPEGAAKYCFECPHQNTCPASCITIYPKHPEWLRAYVADHKKLEDPAFLDAVLRDKNNPYARCVYFCENNAVDHQVVNMQFEGGATAQLTMTAFSTKGGRDFHIHCTKGDIIAFGHTVYLKTFGGTFDEGEVRVVDIDALVEGQYGHGGGDSRMIRDMIEIYENGNGSELTTIGVSLQSHAIGYAAEQSRLAGGKAVTPDCVI